MLLRPRPISNGVKNKSPRDTIPTILVVFGVTGDLATKKIIPSLWHLFGQNLLSDHFSVVGFSRRNFSDKEFGEFIRSAVIHHGGENMSENDFLRFAALFSYQSGTFEDAAAFQILAQAISDKEASWGMCANKLFYLAAPPSTYKPIFENLANGKLNLPCGGDLGWSRVLVEKPFGADLAGAQKLQALLSSYFKEEQIYRIDHYLFKEIVQGIENFRFSNNLFENTWDNTTIERIDIRLHESIGVEGRGNFYDSVGALRDVGQNHLLAMLAALLMEYPSDKEDGVLREHRARVVGALAPWTEKLILENTFRAQYKGYRNINGVSKDSTTETYFALRTTLIHARWQGVPIFLEAGKRLYGARKEIVVTLKHPKECLLCEVGPHRPNQIVFRLEPNDEIVIHFWTKKPGFDRTLEERALSFFLYEKEIKVQYVEEYSKVLYAAIMGEQMSFVSPDEIEAAWKFTDPIVKAWDHNVVPLVEYEPGVAPIPPFFQNNLDAARKEIELGTVLSGGGRGEIGVVGLGKMGAHIALRLIEKKWSVVGFNKTPDATKKIKQEGLRGAYTLEELVGSLQKPRTLWLMVPHEAVDEVLRELTPLLSSGDTIIDGGNSPYKETMRRSNELTKKSIDFLDVGVSGGPTGARNGACLMVGGAREIYKKYEQLFKDLAVEQGYGYMGRSGAGHFVKMVHNGIEYGMMQSIGEGFDVLRAAGSRGLDADVRGQLKFNFNLKEIAKLYNHGSVIESRLIGWLAEAYTKFGDNLDKDECCSGKVSASGEGKWTVEAARELGVPAAIIEGALEFRKQSHNNPSYTGQVVSALRHEFGGHDTSTGNKK